jgi:hypothetical protein
MNFVAYIFTVSFDADIGLVYIRFSPQIGCLCEMLALRSHVPV